MGAPDDLKRPVMLSDQQAREFSRRYEREREVALETLLDAVCLAIKQVTGVDPGDRLRERLRDAIRYEAIL